MERLTKRINGKAAFYECNSTCGTCEGVLCGSVFLMADRLAAYEDTGPEPEEILTGKELAEIACAMNLLKEYQSFGSVEHFRELSQAEKDGRLMVLPCKAGDIVYFPVSNRWDAAAIDQIEIGQDEIRFGWVQNDIGSEANELWADGCFIAEEIGKTVFLTREEAEAALKKREADNEAN